jgi:CrcB protein
MLFLFVCLGGAFGTALRFLLAVSVQARFGPAFPLGTLLVNLIGSFLISLLMYLGVDKGLIATPTRMVLASGVMGGFTTYSSFNFETLRLWQGGAIGLGFLNLGLTVLGCLAMGGLGLLTGKLLAGS